MNGFTDRLNWSDIEDITDVTRWAGVPVWFRARGKIGQGQLTGYGAEGVTIEGEHSTFAVFYPLQLRQSGVVMENVTLKYP